METLPLRDIHLPAPVSWWPLAPGWWLLIIAAGVLVGWLTRVWWRGAVRRRALADFAAIEQAFAGHDDPRRLVRDVSVLLRRVCLTYLPRTSVASLTGKAWRDALRELAPANRALPDKIAWQIVHAPYNPAEPVEPADLINYTRRYLAALPATARAA